jgi:hypothetical protein
MISPTDLFHPTPRPYFNQYVDKKLYKNFTIFHVTPYLKKRLLKYNFIKEKRDLVEQE